jgi:hypothetical protein
MSTSQSIAGPPRLLCEWADEHSLGFVPRMIIEEKTDRDGIPRKTVEVAAISGSCIRMSGNK